MLSVYWRRPEVAEEEMQSCPGELGGRQGRGEQMAPSSPWERPAAARPAQSCPGELGGHQERGAQTDVSPWEWLDTRPARSCQGGNAELPTTPIKDAAPPYISIGRGAKYIWIIT